MIHDRPANPAASPRPQRLLAQGLLVASLTLAGLVSGAQAQSANERAPSAAAAHPSKAFWLDIRGTAAAQSPRGAAPSLQLQRFRALTLDRTSLAAAAAAAPQERSTAARRSATVLSLPHPDGGFQRFTLVDSPVMEAGLAAKHPNIKTYAGRGIDDPTASLRMSITPLGLQASVRSQKGGWYIDPYYHLDESLYASYYTRDAINPRPKFAEAFLPQAQVALERGRFHAANLVMVRGAGYAAGAQVAITVSNAADAAPRQTLYAVAGADGAVSASFVADPYRALGSYSVTLSDGVSSASSSYQVVDDKASLNAAVGSQLRTYRTALLTDPAYATYFGGSANVTAAKVALMNRVTQVYEDETSIRLVLIANNDLLNLDTAAQFSGTNGPCGGTACYPSATVSCTGTVLTRTRQVIGLLVGASAFDIGHIGVGAGGGGVASPGVGNDGKARGCTGLPTPVGDFFAVDYVAHEMGHQFAGNHTFNGTSGSCTGGNRSAANSVEPGGGSSIMAYAGICPTDNLQSNSDPYWSQRSFDEIVTYTSGAEINISEVQLGVLTNFAGTQQFQMRFNGNDSAPIVRGTNFSTVGVKAAVEAIAGWPAGGTVTVSTLGDTAFTITFGGTLAGINTGLLELVNCSGGCTGYVGEIARGGITTRGGVTSPTGNNAPVVTVAAASYTIPIRTPFALTGSATDVDGDTLTYLWEQNDRGNAATNLVSNTKTTGPLFRQFGVRSTSVTNPLTYAPDGQNATTTNPLRVFPDMVQILANNTNAETGVCPVAAATPTGPQVDCFSEFLPTVDYIGMAGVNASPLSLNFKLTARDGQGGINSAGTQLVLAPGAGPFLVTSPNTAVTLDGATPQTVTWNVANTNVAPVSTSNVKITLSADGGATWPYTLAANAANSGSQSVLMPNLATTQARVRVEAVGNVFFDVSNADFTIRLTGDANGDGIVSCLDIAVVRAALGKRTGQPGFNPAADFNNDGVIDIRDLSYVSQRLTAGTRC